MKSEMVSITSFFDYVQKIVFRRRKSLYIDTDFRNDTDCGENIAKGWSHELKVRCQKKYLGDFPESYLEFSEDFYQKCPKQRKLTECWKP